MPNDPVTCHRCGRATPRAIRVIARHAESIADVWACLTCWPAEMKLLDKEWERGAR
jgi:hypothetical protein